MRRRMAAVLLLLVLNGPLAVPLAAALASPLAGPARGHCAMCTRSCCCAPKGGATGCRITRSCAAGEASDPAGAPFLSAPALAVEPVRLQPPPFARHHEEVLSRHLPEEAPAPPDPPPPDSL